MRALVYSNIFVALGASGLCLVTWILLQHTPDWRWASFVFFATLAVYNLDRLVGSNGEDQHDVTHRLGWIHEHRRLLFALTGISAASMTAIGVTLPPSLWLNVLPLAIITGLYSLPILPGRRRLKDLPGAKTFLIAGVWAAATAWLPGILVGEVKVALIIERALFIFAITLPFEIRDVDRDASSGVRSLVHFLGVPQTKILAVAMLALFAGLSIYRYPPALAGALAISAISTVPLVALTRTDRKDYFFSVLMDGTMLLQLGLLVVMQGT